MPAPSPSQPTEIVLVRHGETVWNRQGRWQGHLDSDLTELGQRQAAAIGERLAVVRFDALYSSDLGRAYRTAERVVARTGHRIIPDDRLRERALGIFEGLTVAEIEEQHPDHFTQFLARAADYVIPKGESLRDRHDRAVSCLKDISRRHPGGRIVVVTHGGVLDSAFRHALGLDLTVPRRWTLYNASLSTILVTDGQWTLGTWGDVQHLTEVGSLDDY